LACSGCAIDTERSSLGYGDYLAMSCDQLGQEAVRLMRETTDGSSLEERRDIATLQLKSVKEARAEKNCATGKAIPR
jgi:hypothetical protein